VVILTTLFSNVKFTFTSFNQVFGLTVLKHYLFQIAIFKLLYIACCSFIMLAIAKQNNWDVGEVPIFKYVTKVGF